MATQTVLAASGDIMVANALRQAEPDVMAAYPITPQTIIVEEFDKFVADGRVHTEYVNVESEHSAMSATIGASAAGSRAVTATSSQGLALMYEELPIAAGMRLPIVMANVNRTISAPINIHADHSDIMGVRDAGWIVMFAENAQEAYDNTVCAFRIAENPQVMLPVLTTLDGFTTSHAYERCELMDDATVAEFVGTYEAPYSPLRSPSRTATTPTAPSSWSPSWHAAAPRTPPSPSSTRCSPPGRRSAAVRWPACTPTAWRTPSAPSSSSARPPAPCVTWPVSCAPRASAWAS